MSDLGTLVSGIEYKVRTLTGHLERCKKEIEQLKERHAEMLGIIEEQKMLIRKLKEKNVQLHLNQSIGKRNDAKDVKEKINELVREVDRCITLLNK